ncbi:MAG: ATP-grasp domain-containing protein [Trebonia sp.]
MAVATSGEFVQLGPGTASDRETYDILILDGTYKQSLTAARSLGQAGLRVALGESSSQYHPDRGAAAWRSRYCARAVVLPDYNSDQAAYVDAVVAFVREHRIKVVLPAGDANIVMLAPHRQRFADLHCTLAVASDSAFEIANDKVRTLEVADKLGIAYPKSIPVTGPADLRGVEAEFGYPFVLKPTISWTGEAADRVAPIEVVNDAEAEVATERYLATGCEVLAQQWVPGRREGVTLLIVDGEVLGICGAVAHRTVPPLGGISVMRESIAVPEDILDESISLAKTIGIEGPCEVEWRRDADGRPLLMEVNARLAGTLENANRSGVDFPLLVWQWATGQPIQPMLTYRVGVRTRWISGDLQWLRANIKNPGRPDTMSVPRAICTVLRDFFRTRHYDYLDRSDIWPALGELLPKRMLSKRRWPMAYKD